MTFEEKLKKEAHNKALTIIGRSMRPNPHLALKLEDFGKWTRQETLREVMDPKLFADEFMGCSIPDGAYPDNLDSDGKFQKGSTGTNMMNVSEAEQMFKELFDRVIKKLEAELETSDM